MMTMIMKTMDFQEVSHPITEHDWYSWESLYCYPISVHLCYSRLNTTINISVFLANVIIRRKYSICHHSQIWSKWQHKPYLFHCQLYQHHFECYSCPQNHPMHRPVKIIILIPLGSNSSPPPSERNFHPKKWSYWWWWWRIGSEWCSASPSSCWLFQAWGSLHKCGQDWPSPHIHTCDQAINVKKLFAKLLHTFLWDLASSWARCDCGCPAFSLPSFSALDGLWCRTWSSSSRSCCCIVFFSNLVSGKITTCKCKSPRNCTDNWSFAGTNKILHLMVM